MEMEDQQIFCLGALARKWDRPRWWCVGARRDSLWGFCPRVLFVDKETPFSSCLPGLTAQGVPESTNKQLLIRAPPCGYCSDDCLMCHRQTDVLSRGAGVGARGPAEHQGSSPPNAPCHCLLILMSMPELDPMFLLSQKPPPQNPIPSSNVLVLAGRPMLFV